MCVGVLAFPVIIRSDIKDSTYQSIVCSPTVCAHVCELKDCFDPHHGRTFKAKSHFTLNKKEHRHNLTFKTLTYTHLLIHYTLNVSESETQVKLNEKL